ncbi:MAG: iron-containing redox enzyme family protein [Gaiellaceae bacterium]|jgi:pyrroloquinoline-quinone synthase
MKLIERIDEARARWNVLEHPFYVRWERGELTHDELAHYAGQYRHAVVALAETAAATGDAEHAAEEAAHIELWDDFAAALDAPLAEASPETRECVGTWRRDDALEARAVLYAIEASQPAIARTKLIGLREHYGFNHAGTEYFSLHAERDAEHAEQSRVALVDAPEELATVAEAALRGNWRLLDGCCSS